MIFLLKNIENNRNSDSWNNPFQTRHMTQKAALERFPLNPHFLDENDSTLFYVLNFFSSKWLQQTFDVLKKKSPHVIRNIWQTFYAGNPERIRQTNLEQNPKEFRGTILWKHVLFHHRVIIKPDFNGLGINVEGISISVYWVFSCNLEVSI